MDTFGTSRFAHQVGGSLSPVVAIAWDDEQGNVIHSHEHARGQLLYAVQGVMRVRTQEGLWIIPPLRALWIPPRVVHDVTMLSRVSMRTIYIKPELSDEFGRSCRLLEVSGLLKELILGLMTETIEYSDADRGGLIARLILSEIRKAPTVPIDIPWPRDKRIVAICEHIMRNPGQKRSLEEWSEVAGASARTLIRLFPKETGLRFNHWVRQVHLSEALCRLATGEPVHVIAQELGYASASAFTSMFKNSLGIPPGQYLRPSRLPDSSQ